VFYTGWLGVHTLVVVAWRRTTRRVRTSTTTATMAMEIIQGSVTGRDFRITLSSCGSLPGTMHSTADARVLTLLGLETGYENTGKLLERQEVEACEDHQVPGGPREGWDSHHKARLTVTTNTTTTMDILLVLVSLSFHYAYATSDDQRRRFVKRQRVSSSSSSSSQPTRTSTSTTTPHPPEDSLPASIQTRIPIHSTPSPGGTVQTAIPDHPDPNPDKGPIIGFSIGIVALVLLLIATGWILFRRYKRRKQQRAVSQDAVRLQPTQPYTPSITKQSFEDTQSAASHR